MGRAITYRKYKRSDKKALIRLIGKECGVKRFFEKEKDIMCCSEVYLLNGLIQSDYVRVMDINGVPQGLIAGYIGRPKRKNVFLKFVQLLQWGRLILHKRNRECMHELKKINRAGSDFFSEKSRNEGIISLFVISSGCSGKEKTEFLNLWKSCIKIVGKKESRILLENCSEIDLFKKSGFQLKEQKELMIHPLGQRFRFFFYLYIG